MASPRRASPFPGSSWLLHAEEPERQFATVPELGGSELRRRDYDRFALLLLREHAVRRREAPLSVLPCIRDGTPEDSRAAPDGDHSFCWCALKDLLATDWDGEAGRRDTMGQAAIDELDGLGARIEAAGLRLDEYRLLISFDS